MMLNQINQKIRRKAKSVLKPYVQKYFSDVLPLPPPSTYSLPPYGFFGGYKSWQDVSEACEGYETDEILNKVMTSLLKVKNGEAVYERDSFIFDEIQYAWPLLSCLQNIALNEKSNLHVLDFGGSLGSTFFQNRHFLKDLSAMSWTIVEQEKFVKAGKENFSDNNLKFASTIDEAFKNQSQINCILFSSVMQYLPDPYMFLDQALKTNVKYIIFDRTIFCNRDSDVFTLQKVPPQIYSAQYPARFFNEKTFLSRITSQFEIKASWEGLSGSKMEIHYSDYVEYGYDKGFYFVRK